MNSSRLILWALFIGMLATTGKMSAATNVIPGVTLYDYPAELNGRLAMLLATSEGYRAPSVIFTIDLKSKSLCKIATVPQFGVFTVSENGELFCVRTSESDPGEPKAFLFSTRENQNYTVLLPGAASANAFVGERAFFVIGETNGSRLFEFDIVTGTQKLVQMLGVNSWEHEEFPDAWGGHATNALLFKYRAYRKPLSDAKNYISGVFEYNASTSEIALVPEMRGRPLDVVAADGRYVFFDGPNGPCAGLKLVSALVGHADLEDADIKTRRNVNVLHRFPYRRAVSYWLVGLSPDRKFAYVQKSESLKGNTGRWEYTYVAVDVSKGTVWPILKDRYEIETGCRMYPCVYWR